MARQDEASLWANQRDRADPFATLARTGLPLMFRYFGKDRDAVEFIGAPLIQQLNYMA